MSRPPETRPGSIGSADPAVQVPAPPSPTPAPKLTLLMTLIGRPGGATLAELVAATGWQAHSVRGALSGTLKKKRGLAITVTTVAGRGRVYHLAGEV